MYAYIKGTLKLKEPGRVIIENSGIGYELCVGLSTFSSLPEVPGETMLHTYHYIREDREELYGFSSLPEKNLFQALLGVPGIGAGKAIAILGSAGAGEFAAAVRRRDAEWLSSVKGVGRKTAEKILIDLKDGIEGIEGLTDARGVPETSGLKDAVSALLSLGYTQVHARSMAEAAVSELGEDAATEEIVKRALKENV